MENGWVYWSNSKVLQMLTSGIQLQRGLGAFEITCSISRWYCINLYKNVRMRSGSSVQQVVGNDAYTKTTVVTQLV